MTSLEGKIEDTIFAVVVPARAMGSLDQFLTVGVKWRDGQEVYGYAEEAINSFPDIVEKTQMCESIVQEFAERNNKHIVWLSQSGWAQKLME